MKNCRRTEKVETSLLLVCMVLATSAEVNAQKSPQPTPTSGTNWVSYDEVLHSYVFHGNGVEYQVTSVEYEQYWEALKRIHGILLSRLPCLISISEAMV
jgi:hypothetical protein